MKGRQHSYWRHSSFRSPCTYNDITSSRKPFPWKSPRMYIYQTWMEICASARHVPLLASFIGQVLDEKDLSRFAIERNGRVSRRMMDVIRRIFGKMRLWKERCTIHFRCRDTFFFFFFFRRMSSLSRHEVVALVNFVRCVLLRLRQTKNF